MRGTRKQRCAGKHAEQHTYATHRALHFSGEPTIPGSFRSNQRCDLAAWFDAAKINDMAQVPNAVSPRNPAATGRPRALAKPRGLSV
jgi:hypothetical protein